MNFDKAKLARILIDAIQAWPERETNFIVPTNPKAWRWWIAPTGEKWPMVAAVESVLTWAPRYAYDLDGAAVGLEDGQSGANYFDTLSEINKMFDYKISNVELIMSESQRPQAVQWLSQFLQ